MRPMWQRPGGRPGHLSRRARGEQHGKGRVQPCRLQPRAGRRAQGFARGLWLGVAAMAMVKLTLPMTQIAIGEADAPRLSPWFVTFGRAVVAAGLSAPCCCGPWARLGHARQWRLLAVAALGNAIVYPLLLAWALRSVPLMHAAVVTLAPLITSVAAALMLRQRAGRRSGPVPRLAAAWWWPYSLWRAQRAGLGLAGARDLWLALAVLGRRSAMWPALASPRPWGPNR